MRLIAGISLLFLLGLLLNASILVFAAIVVTVVYLLARYQTRRATESLSAERTVSTEELEVGETISVQIRLNNRDTWNIPWVLFEDMVPARALHGPPPSLRLEGSNVRMCNVPASGNRVISYKVEALRRGYYQLGPAIAETGDLLGLHRRFRRITDATYVLVLPKLIPLLGYDVASRRPVGEIKVSYRLQEDPTLVSGIREYAPGDPIRRIHWRASARVGKLQCKEYQPTSVAGAMLVLDMHEESNPVHHEPVRGDLAVTAAASICHSLMQMQQQFGVISNGRDAIDRVAEATLVSKINKREPSMARNRPSDGTAIDNEGDSAEFESVEAARKAVGMRDSDDRMRPILLPCSRGPEHFVQVHRTLGRLERTDGLKLEELLVEAQGKLPRDATILVILQEVSDSAALALGVLTRQGFSVAAIVNAYDNEAFTSAVARLLAQRVMVYHLLDEETIPHICEALVLKY